MNVNEREITILYVEDDPYLSLIIVDFLEDKGYTVLHFSSAESGLTGFKKNKTDICILDIGLPHKNGLWLGKEIKKINNDIPVIFLTAQKEKRNILEGFSLGADDYIRKPFLPDELFLRINAVLTRSGYQKSRGKEIYELGHFTFYYKSQLLKAGLKEFELSYRETELLKLFCKDPDEILKREFLLKKVWGYSDLNLSRSMDVYITRLRNKLKYDPGIKIINIRNVGFKMIINKAEDEG